VHCDAASASDTDWTQILHLYDHLYSLSPTPVIALNRAVAVGEVHGAAEALAEVNALDLPTYHLFHATRGDLLRRLGRHLESAAAYARAEQLAANETERRFLAEHVQTLRGSSPPQRGTTTA
jgi:RNA polymerase sigma-70 factor (ECF subfamily)